MTNEQITQLFEKHSHPNNDFEPVWMMNEADFATAIREAIEQASQPQGAICKINIPDPYNKGFRIIGWRIKDDGSHLLDQMNRLP